MDGWWCRNLIILHGMVQYSNPMHGATSNERRASLHVSSLVTCAREKSKLYHGRLSRTVKAKVKWNLFRRAKQEI